MDYDLLLIGVVIYCRFAINSDSGMRFEEIRTNWAHLQSSVFKLSKDLIDSIHEEGIVAYTS